MRYHYEVNGNPSHSYGKVYSCEHPVYKHCTLFKIGELGLAVIQQHWDEEWQISWWGEIDPKLTDAIYLNPKFKEYFNAHAGLPENRIYPTVPIRKLMWALRMKPLPKSKWETTFDREMV